MATSKKGETTPKEAPANAGGASKIAIERLQEAVRRLAKGNNVTEEQQQEILWLAAGKDPEKELAKLAGPADDANSGIVVLGG